MRPSSVRLSSAVDGVISQAHPKRIRAISEYAQKVVYAILKEEPDAAVERVIKLALKRL